MIQQIPVFFKLPYFKKLSVLPICYTIVLIDRHHKLRLQTCNNERSLFSGLPVTVVALETGALSARRWPVLGRGVAQFRVEELGTGHGHDL